MSGLIGAVTELESIMQIQSVDIQTSSGISLYQKQFQKAAKDSSLVSGFSTALSYMFDTVSEDKKEGFESFRSDNMYVIRHNLTNSSIIIISARNLEKAILKKIARSHRTIDRRFETNFKGSRSGYDPLPVEEIDKIFARNDFKIGLLELLQLDVDNIKKLLNNPRTDSLLEYYLEILIEYYDMVKDKPYFIIKELMAYLHQKELNKNKLAALIMKTWKAGAFKRHTGPVTNDGGSTEPASYGYEFENMSFTQNDVSP